MPKLIVHIIDRMPADGAERLLVEILRYRNTNHNYHLLCLVEGGPLVAQIQDLGIPVTIMNKNRGVDIRHAWQLYRWLAEHKPTIVHTHLFTADAWGRTCAWLARVPGIFSTVHSINSWKNRLHLSTDRLLARISHKVIACSNLVATHLVQEGIAKEKIVSIANGVDLERVSRAVPVNVHSEFSLGEQTKILCLVGRLHPAKGHLDLFPVLQEIIDEIDNFVLLIVGEGELETELRDEARKRKLHKNIIFTGFRQDVLGILKASDYLLMPSRWEGLPMTLLESMACGTPALAASVGGIPDVITHKVNGLMYKAGDSNALGSALRTLLLDQVDRQAMSSAAKNTVVDKFSAQSIAAEYENLYAEIE